MERKTAMKNLWKRQWKKLVVFSLAAVFLAVNGKALAEEFSSRRLSILSVQGDEGFVIKGGSREVKAAGGMPLGQGSQVRTGIKTTMYLEADDDKVVKLDSNTLVEISKASSKKLNIALKSGELFFHVEKPLGSGEEMSFDAAQTSMSIRGTGGILKFGESRLELFLIEGHVEWDMGNETVAVEPGQRVTLRQVTGNALERSGMRSAYEPERVTSFDWRDLDALGLEAVLERRERMDLSVIGLDTAEAVREAETVRDALREEQNSREEAQRQKEEESREQAGTGGDSGGVLGGIVRMDREPAGDSDDGNDNDEVALIDNREESTGAETEPIETEPEETEPGETEPEETEPVETEPEETEPIETEPIETEPEETEPEETEPDPDWKAGENGDYLYKVSDGSKTWYYYESSDGSRGTVSGGTWIWSEDFLNEYGLSKTP